MECHPSHWRTHIFQRGRSTTNQIQFQGSPNFWSPKHPRRVRLLRAWCWETRRIAYRHIPVQNMWRKKSALMSQCQDQHQIFHLLLSPLQRSHSVVTDSPIHRHVLSHFRCRTDRQPSTRSIAAQQNWPHFSDSRLLRDGRGGERYKKVMQTNCGDTR